MATQNLRIQVRRDTSENWTSANPVLLAGEYGFETNSGKLKIGDGSTSWDALGYLPAGAGGDLSFDGETGMISFTQRTDEEVTELAQGAISVTEPLTYEDGVVGADVYSKAEADAALLVETERAIAAEGVNAAAIAAETTRATEAEAGLGDLIAAEGEVRADADTALSDRLDVLEADPTTKDYVDQAVLAEQTQRENADNQASARLDELERDHVSSDPVNGIAAEFTGNLTGDVTGNLTGDVAGDVTGNLTGDVTGSVTGDVTGNLTGDVTGSVTGDVTGNLTGDVTGSVTGDVTGNLTGDVTGDVTGSVTGSVTGNLTGDVTGDVTGNLTGDVTGNVSGSAGYVSLVTFDSENGGSLPNSNDGTIAVDTKSSGAAVYLRIPGAWLPIS